MGDPMEQLMPPSEDTIVMDGLPAKLREFARDLNVAFAEAKTGNRLTAGLLFDLETAFSRLVEEAERFTDRLTRARLPQWHDPAYAESARSDT
jgi:hypothetical protein